MPSSKRVRANKLLRLTGFSLLALIFVLTLTQAVALAQEIDQDKLEEGARLYQENCAVCHGPEGEGRIGATLAKDWPSIRPDLTIKSTIANGIPGSVMPAWSQENGGPLNEEQIDALAYYIQSWQTGGVQEFAPTQTFEPRTPITPPPNVEGDPNEGAVLFDQNCAVCHGPEGQGRVGATLAKDWPSIRPDLTIKTTISNGVPGSVMPAWSQERGGPLTDTQINDLVAFILSQTDGDGVVQVSPTVSLPGESTLPFLDTGWGVLLFFVLFAVIVAIAIIAQRRTSE